MSPGAGGGTTFRADAPVVIRGEREVGAAPAEVWRVLTRFEAWHLWHPGIRQAILQGELAEGAPLHWRADGMSLVSRVVELEEGRRVGWTVRTLGARGYQRWSLEPVEAAGRVRTRVRLEESWEGLVVRLLRRTLTRTLERSRLAWMDGLERRAEDGNECG